MTKAFSRTTNIASKLVLAKEALDSIKKAVFIDGKNAFLRYNLGVAFHELSMDKEAIETFTVAIDLGIKNPCAFCMRAISRHHLGDNVGSLADLDKAALLGFKKPCDQFHEARADTLCKLGRYEEASGEIAQAIQLNPDALRILITQADIFSRIGNSEEAKKTLDRVFDLQKKKNLKFSAEEANGIAYVFYLLKEYSRGLEYAENAIKQEPNNACILDTLACIQSGLGLNETSLDTFERAIKEKKSDTDVTWDELANVLEKLGKSDEAKSLREKHKKS
jgi:tetratricopeptide (TPR) repeat protein